MFFFQVLKALSNKGININAEGILFKDSPIFYCCRYGHEKLIEFIIDKYPDILFTKTIGGLGECPRTEYIEIWSELTRIIKKEDGVITGMFCVCACLQMLRIGDWSMEENLENPKMVLFSLSALK